MIETIAPMSLQQLNAFILMCQGTIREGMGYPHIKRFLLGRDGDLQTLLLHWMDDGNLDLSGEKRYDWDEKKREWRLT